MKENNRPLLDMRRFLCHNYSHLSTSFEEVNETDKLANINNLKRKPMKAKTIAFILLAVLLALFTTPVYAQGDVPPLPHAFYGTVKINGSPAPVGTEVEARGEGVLTGVEGNPVITTVAGKYGGSGPLEPKLIVQGEIADGAILTFYVNGVSTGQTAEWHSGEVTEINLTVSIPPGTTETPPPETTETPPPETTETLPPEPTETLPPEPTETLPPEPTETLPPEPTETLPPEPTESLPPEPTETLPPGTTLKPAAFNLSSLIISSNEVTLGESVTISVEVANTGEEAGNYKVTLKIDGVVEASKEITVSAGASQKVTFTTAKDLAGTYAADINGLSGIFVVMGEVPPAESGNWPVLWGVIGGVIVLGLIIFLVPRRKAY